MEAKMSNEIRDEILIGNKPIPIYITLEIMKSICKIIVIKNNKKSYGTGFFMFFSDALKFLITNYHIISPDLDNKFIELEIWTKKKIKLKLDNRLIIYLKKPKDITAIEIKEIDDMFQDIKLLDYDINYIQNGFTIYKDAEVFTIEHPRGKNAASASGKILEVKDYEFIHNISTDFQEVLFYYFMII